jgi:hypothetical protein
MACAAGKMLHRTGLRMLQIECTGMKTPILGVCDRIDAARKLVCRLYDQKGKLKEDHVDLNKLKVRLATLRDACLAKPPPCEATFTQHVLQTRSCKKSEDIWPLK